MGTGWSRGVRARMKRNEKRILLLGLDGAGKTTLVLERQLFTTLLKLTVRAVSSIEHPVEKWSTRSQQQVSFRVCFSLGNAFSILV